MKKVFTTVVFICFTMVSFSQAIKSGNYGNALSLAFDSTTKKLTGYFGDCTGWDEEAKLPRFCCLFYIEGMVTHHKFRILTYYPGEKTEDTITGEIEMINEKSLTIKLPDEHGGCWNVQQFADKPVQFDLEEETQWTQISYVMPNKTYFYSDKLEEKKLRTYLVKNDIVCIDKMEGDWAYCTFYAERITRGWIKTKDLNTF